MASFRVEWKKSTKKDLRKLPATGVARVVEAVELLSANPFPQGAEKLSGADHSYRIRLGDYRVTTCFASGNLLKSSASDIAKCLL